MAIQLTIYVIARDDTMTTGLWCPYCLLPSGYELVFDRISGYGVTANFMTMRKCRECDANIPKDAS